MKSLTSSIHILIVLTLPAATMSWLNAAPPPQAKAVGINVVLNTGITPAILSQLGRHGNVRDVVNSIHAVTLQAPLGNLAAIRSLPCVAAANPDAERSTGPVGTAELADFSEGMSTWNLDAINVTDYGAGVYVAVLDSGLVRTWPYYFPRERIATEYAISFGGGGGGVGWVSSQPNKWENDQDSHGTHVTSTILGYWFPFDPVSGPVNGVAPKSTVIPVKVINQNGRTWSSVVARGIAYVAHLKAGPLADYPVVINMSLGGPGLDAMEKAAIDYAISQGVIVVASAGNQGAAGMDYPAAYEPVISVAASGWVEEWKTGTWWLNDVADPTDTSDFYITDFSSRALEGQDLDVAAPGSWIVGPYQVDSGHLSYYFLGGTSMASPHVAGIVALMAQKNSALTAAQAESILEANAIPLLPGCRTVLDVEYCWEANATGAGLVNAAAALDATPWNR